jgi:hypothetical protein
MVFLRLTLYLQLFWTLGHPPVSPADSQDDVVSELKDTRHFDGAVDGCVFQVEENSCPFEDQTRLKTRYTGKGARGSGNYRFSDRGPNIEISANGNVISLTFNRLLLYPFHCFT